MAIPLLDGSGFTKETINVEYEWQPPRCSECKIFGHSDEHCPKHVQVTKDNVEDDEGFVTANRKGGKKKTMDKQHARKIDGVRLTKPKPSYYYRPVQKANKP